MVWQNPQTLESILNCDYVNDNNLSLKLQLFHGIFWFPQGEAVGAGCKSNSPHHQHPQHRWGQRKGPFCVVSGCCHCLNWAEFLTVSQYAYLSLLSSSRTYNTSSAAAQVWFQSKVRIWPSRDQIPGCRLDPPPILPLYQVCSGDDFRRLLTTSCPECLSPHRSINIRSARLRSFTRIQAELLRWQQHQYNVVGACISPVCVNFSCSSTRPVNKLFNTTTIL